MILVRYGELALKGGNRVDFERQLANNIRIALESVAPAKVERHWGRMFVFPERRTEVALARLREVFGITSLSPTRRAELDVEAIGKVAEQVLDEALAERTAPGPVSFRVRATRSEKRFALTSVELDRVIGGRLKERNERLTVDLEEPDIVVGLDVRAEGAFVFARRVEGPGGLPVGTLGRALCLISGGFDSPVSAYLSMKRGLSLAYVTYHSAPFIGESARKKVVDLVRVLSRFQPRHSRLWVVPFAASQIAIRDLEVAGYRTVLYRRMMQRIASRLAEREEAQALVTGECLGQVASQTLENLTCIQAAATLPVIRPLVSFDKEETIRLARRIGTFELSAVQEPDCCTLFMPTKPVIRGRPEFCEELESRLNVEQLVEAALASAELVSIPPEG
ncbi:MAG: tRNA 4-thiouridine(8) synthase ThiI [Planctomycetes bacterium]|nr:tRNA 4-thiouridine(8) synthase ThiI [Planctomycetota bacterium]